MKLLNFVGLSIGTVLAIAQSAVGIPYEGNTVYRSTVRGDTVLILSGSPNTRITFFAPNPTERFRYQGTDSCGWAQVNLPTDVQVTNFKVNGDTKNPYAAGSASSYNCRDSSANISGNERYNPTTKTYFFRGSGPRQAITFSWQQPSERRVRINDCGFGEVNLRGVNLAGTITVEGQNYVLNSLAFAAYPPLCRIVEGVRVPYVPATNN